MVPAPPVLVLVSQYSSTYLNIFAVARESPSHLNQRIDQGDEEFHIKINQGVLQLSCSCSPGKNPEMVPFPD